MTIDEIRRKAPVGFHRKTIAYRIKNGSVEYLIARKGIDGKLSVGYPIDNDWISIQTNKPL